MKTLIEHIASKEYLGRMFAIGKAPTGEDVVAYAVTGRSDSSRARRLEAEWAKSRVRTSVTDPEQLKKGNPSLLLYNAIVLNKHGDLVVSNGVQTDLIVETQEKYDLSCEEHRRNCATRGIDELRKAFSRPVLMLESVDETTGEAKYIDITSFEPDSPNYTPRISAVVGRTSQAISIARKSADSDSAVRSFSIYDGAQLGQCAFVSTYEGTNVPKGAVIPSFVGEPLQFSMDYNSPEKLANDIYEALGPKAAGPGIISPGDDFRVGVTAVFYQREPRPIIRSFTRNFHKEAK
jgi:IMP cyclohydrolase